MHPITRAPDDDESSGMAVAVYQPTGTPRTMEMVRPLVDATAAKQAIEQYEALKAAIVQPSDIQMYQGRPFLKKRFWRRVATFFGISLELVSQDRGHDEVGHLFYSIIYRAIAPNGRTMIGDGYCSTAERGHETWPEHTVRATAHTRAKNRAISDLVGGGEVSAEEMPDHDDEVSPPTRRQPAPTARPARVQPAPQRTVNADPTKRATAEQLAEVEYLAAELGMDPPNVVSEIQAALTIRSMRQQLERRRPAATAATGTPALEELPTGTRAN